MACAMKREAWIYLYDYNFLEQDFKQNICVTGMLEIPTKHKDQ